MPQAKMGQSTPSFDPKKVLPTPSFADTIVVEIVSKKEEDYAEIPYGTPHPDTALFPDHRLVLQVQQSEEDFVRYYAADRATQQTFNANISYSGESASHPIFTRDHLIRRSAYTSTARNTPLTGLVDADVTTGGSGYDPETTTAILSGGTGSGGEVSVIVNAAGVVTGLYVTALGNYTAAPTLTIVGAGTGATGTVSIQPQGAVLVKEDVAAKTGDERVDGLYVLVRFVYETLPGPLLVHSRVDDQLGRIQGTHQAVLNTGQLPSRTSTQTKTYSARDGSAIVLWEIIEYVGAGVPGFTAYPLLEGEELSEQVRGEPILSESQVVDAGTPADSGARVISSIVTAINEFQSVKKTLSLGALPPDETYIFYRNISCPLLVFDIVPTVYCNLSAFAKLTMDYVTAEGASSVRAHRITIKYHETAPPYPFDTPINPPYETADLRFSGPFTSHSLPNCLNDAISFSGTFAQSSSGGACAWTEEWDYPATVPSASDYAAGMWLALDFQVKPFGQSMYISFLLEFYTAPGEPPP